MSENDDILALYREAPWAKEWTDNQIIDLVEEGHCFFHYCGQKIVGIVRIITDGVSVSYVCDVIVKKEYRNSGIGKQLVTKALAHPFIKKTTVVLLTRDATDFYKKLGFEERTAMVWRKK